MAAIFFGSVPARIVRSLELALAEIEHVKGEGGEAETVTELLDEDTGTDVDEVRGLDIREVNVDKVG